MIAETLAATKTKWTLDPVHSELLFRVKHLMISTVTGRFKKFDLTGETEGEDFTKLISCRLVAGLHSIDTNNEQRDNHLRSNDFFFSDKVLKNMRAYTWTGNIRELENLMERSVLLAKGTIIEDISLPAVPTMNNSRNVQDFHVKTIHKNERDYIIAVLKKCNGRIWGSGGAAEVLNIPPTTLKSKMKKLGIGKENNE